MSVRLSACISAASSGRICMEFDTGDSDKKICQETPNYIQIRQKYRALYMHT